MSEIQWPPQVGDHVQVVSTGASGVVMDGGDGHHVRVGIYSRKLGSVTTAPYRTFMLRELAPESVPPPTAPPGPAETRRRSGRLPASE
jgi:hypothetical protein